MKVLHVIGNSRFGGGTRCIISLAEMAREYAAEVRVLTTDPMTIEVLEGLGFETVQLNYFRREINPVLDLAAALNIYRYLKLEKYDIVHTHTSKGGIIGRWAAYKARVPIVIHTVHGFAFHEGSSRKAIALYSMIEKMAAKWADKIIVVNNYDREWGIRLGIFEPDKAITIHNGIDFSAWTRPPVALKEELGIKANEMVIGMVSRLFYLKGLEDLIDAMPKVLKTFPSAKLILVGEGPLEGLLRKQAIERGVERHVTFTGFRKDAREFYQIFDVFAFASHREAMSITLLEAMAAGCAIVATDIKGNREMIEDGVNGLMVPPANPERLADKMLRLLKDRGYAASLGRAARHDYETKYTDEVMKRQTWGLYMELCKAKGISLEGGELGTGHHES